MDRTHHVPLPTPMETPTPSAAAALGKRVLSTLILLPAFVWVVAFAPVWVFTLVIVLVASLGQWEFTRMFAHAGVRPFSGLALVGGAAVTASFGLPEAVPVALSLVVLGVLTVGLARGSQPASWEPAAITLLGICYVNWLLGYALWLRGLPGGVGWVLLLVWVTWIGETAAYLVGSTLGRHQLAPVVSPKKTMEGSLAQLLVSAPAALVAGAWLFPERSAWDAVVVGLLLGVVGQLGDLVESLLKRSVGTKDTGHIIPGHGGMLDRLDGLLFNAPVLFYYVTYGRLVGA